MGKINTSPRHNWNGSALIGGVGGVNLKEIEKMRYF